MIIGNVGAKRNKKRDKTLHGVRKGINLDHARASEMVQKLECMGVSVARFLEMTDLDGWDK